MAEKFGFQKRRRQGRAIDGDKRLLLPSRTAMDEPGNQFLSGAAFPDQQYGTGSGGRLFTQGQYIGHGLASEYDPGLRINRCTSSIPAVIFCPLLLHFIPDLLKLCPQLGDFLLHFQTGQVAATFPTVQAPFPYRPPFKTADIVPLRPAGQFTDKNLAAQHRAGITADKAGKNVAYRLTARFVVPKPLRRFQGTAPCTLQLQLLFSPVHAVPMDIRMGQPDNGNQSPGCLQPFII